VAQGPERKVEEENVAVDVCGGIEVGIEGDHLRAGLPGGMAHGAGAAEEFEEAGHLLQTRNCQLQSESREL